MSDTEHVFEDMVFDAEPIIVWADQRPGADRVEEHLAATYHGTIEAAISRVNLTEIYYVCASLEDRAFAIQQTQYLANLGVEIVGDDRVWEHAARHKHRYTPNFPLGDAFALATADVLDRPLLAGDDAHWDDPESDGYRILRI